MRDTPALYSSHLLGATKIVPIFRFTEPAALTGCLAGASAGALRAIPLVTQIARIRVE